MSSPPRSPTRPTALPMTVGPREWEKSLTIKCRFCGGPKCKRCSEHAALLKTDSPVAGLHADWVTDSILGMMRPSSRLMQTYRIADQFQRLKIKAVFNLTMPGEHPHCGDGNGPSGFPYDPEMDLMAHQIQFYNFGWEDMTSPNLSLMLDIATVMASVLAQAQQKVAVHCHAGYGRTGLAIACTLIFQHGISAAEAIAIVRRGRPGSIQTHGQVAFVGRFHDYLRQAKLVFALPTIHDRFSLSTILERERFQFQPTPPETSMVLPPRVVRYLCSQIEVWTARDLCALSLAFVGHLPATTYSISLLPHLQLLQMAERVDVWADHVVSSDVLLPIKAQMNSGEPNWPQTSTTPIFAGLLLDWLEHLNPPLLDSDDLHDVDRLRKVPLAALRTLERLVCLLRVGSEALRTQSAELPVDATTLLEGLYARTAMAVVQAPSLRARSLIPPIKYLVESHWTSPSPLKVASVAPEVKIEPLDPTKFPTLPPVGTTQSSSPSKSSPAKVSPSKMSPAKGSSTKSMALEPPIACSLAPESPPKLLEKLPRRPSDVTDARPIDKSLPSPERPRTLPEVQLRGRSIL
ncbi:hypothetical protein SDRG_06188 [Saprolegnia diclina VS20]|uniref:Tyrosine specific protein phosphatases domain-containing protein n=1 Tax=Saprolegnia diclina (strain VS20) TaxID=1156394 RepID=T0RW77_SAPDV|nr:hypothetical protein SDRG_06188 [Saprolegnia diclina VS20]EQC36753.1 hypothetical protein SDRG_06188 [Saprolegnia diclina VS20]|eukprot:XP_008610174.1 hypothetical protein SDRG_06188 [Saprolegnia diclina VS20]